LENTKKLKFEEPILDVKNLSKALYETTLHLDKTTKKLEKSEALRNTMIANLSHDFRSPLTTLKSYTEYLLSTDLDDKDEIIYTLNQMNKKIEMIDYMVNEFFTLTSLDYSGFSVNMENTNIYIYLNEVFETFSSDKKYIKRILTLDLSIPDNINVLIDKNLFYLLLDNLFVNALKFSNDNDFISLKAYIDGDIKISVCDSGIGIDKKNLKKIFEETYMVSDSRPPSSYQKGCGLGLPIAKKIAKLHHGNLICISEIGTGSEFIINIPINNN